MYFDGPETDVPLEAGMDMRLLLSVNGLAVVLVMPWVGTVVDLCRSAIAGLP